MLPYLLFFISSIVIVFGGIHLAKISDILADRTGLGEALMGGLVLGASTSIAGSSLSIYSAYQGHSDLAIGNAIGGIALQTFFLCLADILYRKSNLEHAVASTTNIMLGILLIFLFGITTLTFFTPEWTFFQIHPMTFSLFLFYFFGIRITSREKKEKMWKPVVTKETVEDTPDQDSKKENLKILWFKFLGLAALLIVAGIFIEENSITISKKWGFSQVVLGVVFTAFVTSLPELVLTLSAVKRGALTLAVGGIIGGNTFDVLVLPVSDFFYKKGSLIHQMKSSHITILLITMLMMSCLIMGLVRREKYGFAGIGIETLLIALLYVLGVTLLFVG